jgi:hypothetical protein
MKVLKISVFLVALLLVNIPVHGVQGAANPGFMPPTAQVQGKTMAEWSALNWQFMYEVPLPQSPFLNNAPNCVSKAIGNVLLLNGNWGMPIDCTVPAGMFIVFSGMGAGCDDLEPEPFYGADEGELYECATQELFTFANLKASIDGISLQNPERYVVISSLETFTTPDENIFGVPGGTEGMVMGKSFNLMLAPLSVGKHVFYAYGELPNAPFISEYTVNLTVVP